MTNKRSNDRTNSQYGGGERGKQGRPRWKVAARVLVMLLVVELGLVAVFFGQLGSMGFFERLPIVQKIKGTAPLSPPESLEPADSAAATEAPDTEFNPNLAVGKTPIYAQPIIDPNVLNVLVLGLDTQKPGGNGRSDLNMIISIDHKNKTIKLVSLLRDTLVPIEGHDWNRLNSAYAYGGPGLAINTINEVYGMDIQRYVKLDFFAIRDIIDAVGGVEVKLTDAEITYLRSYGHNVSKGAGVKHLDGEVALAYARIRKIDTDFQRTQRQRNVMTAALGKVRGMGVIAAIDLMTKLLPQVKTNINTNESIQLAREIIAMKGTEMKQIAIPIQGSWSDKKYKGMLIISADFKKNTEALKSFLYEQGK